MADHLAQFPMLGSGFNSQLIQNPNASGPSQQQQPSDSMQPIGGLSNPEHNRMWMQLHQQLSQQRTTSAGDIVGSQVPLDPFLVPSSSLFRSFLPPFSPPPFPTLPSPPCVRPCICIFSSDTALRPTLTLSSLGFAYVSSGFCYVLTLPLPLPTVL